LDTEHRRYLSAVLAGLVIACILGGTASAFAQTNSKAATDKWRPKDGPYASPGKDFDSQCVEFGDIIIELAKKSISGNEWSCEINKFTDTASSEIRLDMTCSDYNLAESLGLPEERKFREVLLLKRIDDKAMSVRKTLNGKFKGPGWQADYCPAEAQRMYIEAEAARRTAGEYKVPEQLLNPQQWRPRDGVYASLGAGFGDRCAKSGDVIVGLADGSVVSDQGECKAVGLMNTGIASISMDVTCNQTPGKQATVSENKKDGASPETKNTEIVRMRKIDDNTFFLQKTQNRQFKDAGGPVAYCSEDAQQTYAAKRTRK
jgi:hypothetical protein